MEQYSKLRIGLHRRGINIRCLGLVRSHSKNKIINKFFLTEIAARVAKKILFGRMRQLTTSEDIEYRKLIIDYFNLLFDNSKECQDYWKSGIKNSLLKRFSAALTPEERDNSFDLRSVLHMKPLFFRLQEICGIRFHSHSNNKVLEYEDLLKLDQPIIQPIISTSTGLSVAQGGLLEDNDHPSDDSDILFINDNNELDDENEDEDEEEEDEYDEDNEEDEEEDDENTKNSEYIEGMSDYEDSNYSREEENEEEENEEDNEDDGEEDKEIYFHSDDIVNKKRRSKSNKTTSKHKRTLSHASGQASMPGYGGGISLNEPSSSHSTPNSTPNSGEDYNSLFGKDILPLSGTGAGYGMPTTPKGLAGYAGNNDIISKSTNKSNKKKKKNAKKKQQQQQQLQRIKQQQEKQQKELERMKKEKEEENARLRKFGIHDIKEIYAIEKSIHQIDFAEGTFLSRRATADDDSDHLFLQADERFAAALERKSDDFRTLHNWSLSLLYRANRKQGEEANKLYDKACEKLEAALIVNKDDSVAYFLWGNIFSERAIRMGSNTTATITGSSFSSNKLSPLVNRVSNSPLSQLNTQYQSNGSYVQVTQKQLLQLACEKYQFSFQRDKKSFDLLYNWGNALLHLAKIDLNNAEEFYKEACEKYSIAVTLNNQSVKAYRNWAVALSKLARMQTNCELKDKLFSESEEKYSFSLEHNSNDSEVYFNWGNVHYHRAREAASRGNQKLAFQQLVYAGEKYMASLENGHFNRDALFNWGKILNIQIHLNPSDHPDSYSISLVVEIYLTFFYSFIIHENSFLSLKPIAALASQSSIPEISMKAIECLRKLSQDAYSSQIKLEADRALRVIESKNMKKSIMNQISINNHHPPIPSSNTSFIPFSSNTQSASSSSSSSSSNNNGANSSLNSENASSSTGHTSVTFQSPNPISFIPASITANNSTYYHSNPLQSIYSISHSPLKSEQHLYQNQQNQQNQQQDSSHPSVSLFLKKLEATRETSLIRSKGSSTIPPLSDFQRLTVALSKNSWIVNRKGSLTLYVLKTRPAEKRITAPASRAPSSSSTGTNSFAIIPSTELPQASNQLHERMLRVLQGKVPFLAPILYSYLKDGKYYIIQQNIPDEYLFSKIRQNAITNKGIDQINVNDNSPFIINEYSNHQQETRPTIRRSKSDLSISTSANFTSSAYQPNKLIRSCLCEHVARFYIAEIIILFGYLHSCGFIYGYPLLPPFFLFPSISPLPFPSLPPLLPLAPCSFSSPFIFQNSFIPPNFNFSRIFYTLYLPLPPFPFSSFPTPSSSIYFLSFHASSPSSSLP